jgi:hypothetical protein
MRKHQFSTRTHRSEYCDQHDVSGCSQIECRAQALGVTVEQYEHFVTKPVQGSIRRIERRNQAIRNSR